MDHYKSKLKEMYDNGIYDDEDEMYMNDDLYAEPEEEYIEPDEDMDTDMIYEPEEDEYEYVDNPEEEEMMDMGGYYESKRPDWARNNKKIKEQDEKSEEEKAKESIKWLIDNDWGKSNEIEGQASERFKALSFNDSDISNKFLDEINKFTSSLENKYIK
jgi:hypothetical protein